MAFILYLYTLVTLAVIDSIWLFSMSGWYKKMLGHLFAPAFNFTPAVIFYFLYAAGVVYFVLMPAVRNGWSFGFCFGAGFLLGLVAYGAYDLTNHATLKSWPLSVTVVDMLWGAMLTGTASLVALLLYMYFNLK